MPHVVLITPGQPSSNPRLQKEALALFKAGYKVTVIYCFWTAWADAGDEKLFASYPGIQWIRVGGHPVHQKGLYWLTRVRRKLYSRISGIFPSSIYWLTRSVVRCGSELLNKATSVKADLYIAHNLGALPAAIKAAKKWNKPCGFDAEDYHRGQFREASGKEFNVTVSIEKHFMPQCTYITAASPLIANAYESVIPIRQPIVINNVFSLSNLQPSPVQGNENDPLTLFWFSQTVGPERGLEVVVAALELLKEYNIRFTLLGDCTATYRSKLQAALSTPSKLQFIGPVELEEVFRLAALSQVGIAAEEPVSENRDICLTNKLFTYMLSGNCVLASNTKGQKKLLEENPGIGLLYSFNDAADLARQIRLLYENRSLLHQCRMNAWKLGRGVYNWENESVKFTELVKQVVSAAS